MDSYGRIIRSIDQELLMQEVSPVHDISRTRIDHQSLSSSSPLSLDLERISLLLSRWSALTMAVQNKWGGPDSFKKYDQLVSDIASWFSQPIGYQNAEDLESLLHERLLLSFNTEIEDGSIEEVAEELMVMMNP